MISWPKTKLHVSGSRNEPINLCDCSSFNLLQGSLIVVATKLLSMKCKILTRRQHILKSDWWMRETIRDPIMSIVVIVIQVDPQHSLFMDQPRSIWKFMQPHSMNGVIEKRGRQTHWNWSRLAVEYFSMEILASPICLKILSDTHLPPPDGCHRWSKTWVKRLQGAFWEYSPLVMTWQLQNGTCYFK